MKSILFMVVIICFFPLTFFPVKAFGVSEGIEIYEIEKKVVVSGFLNTRYLRKPSATVVVYREGFSAKRSLFISHADPFELIEGLLQIDAIPGVVSVDSPEEDIREGSRLNVFIRWEGTPRAYALSEIVESNFRNEFDIRFLGNIENVEKVKSGDLLCLDSCNVGITGNVSIGGDAYDRGEVTFNVNRKILPPNGTEVEIIFQLVSEEVPE